jgi:hypothetical protein
MTFTDADMRVQVARALGGSVDDFDVTGIVDRLQEEFGTVDIDDVPAADFWEIVEKSGN